MSLIRRIAILSAAVLVSLGMTVQPYAASGTCSVLIDYSCGSGSDPISGAGFSAVKVASYDDSSGSWVYTWEEPYAGVGTSPNNLTTDDIKRICPYLIDVEKRNGLSALSGITDADGRCTFTDLARGLYLIWQDSSSGEALSYETASPALVGLPSYEKESGLLYDVTIYPKTQVRTESGNTAPDRAISAVTVTSDTSLSAKPGNVRTDDESDIYIPIALIAISLLAILSIWQQLNRKFK